MNPSFQTRAHGDGRLFIGVSEFKFTTFSIPVKRGFRCIPHAEIPENKPRNFWRKRILPTLMRAAKAVVANWPGVTPTVHQSPAHCKIAPERASGKPIL